MGEYRDDTPEELRQHLQTMNALGKALPTTGLGALVEGLGAGSQWPENLTESPMILDTDIGGDPDDTIAVAAAARYVPRLALVLTTDETGSTQGYGSRARFARCLMDALGRAEVPVAAGASLGDTKNFYVDGLIPDTVPAQPDDVVGAVRAVCGAHDGPVRWVGMGPLSNLAIVLQKAPDLAHRLRVTQMGGALRYRETGKVEHNIRRDVSAAHTVLEAVRDGRLFLPEFISSEITFTSSIEVTSEHALYSMLNASDAPAWAQLLIGHLDQWFKCAHSGTMQHDALTLSAALDLPFVESERMMVYMDDVGRTTVAGVGTPVRWSVHAEYEAFMSWLILVLDPRVPASRLLLTCSES